METLKRNYRQQKHDLRKFPRTLSKEDLRELYTALALHQEDGTCYCDKEDSIYPNQINRSTGEIIPCAWCYGEKVLKKLKKT